MNPAATLQRPERAIDPATLPGDVRLMRVGAGLLLGVALLAVLVSALAWAMRRPAFALREIQLVGEVAHTRTAALATQVLPRLKGGYFDMDLMAAKAAFEDLPWVRHAQVRRVWPQRLVVSLEEHVPVAYWERPEGDPHLVNRFGEVFEVNLGDLEDDELPTLRGPGAESAPQVWAMWQRLQPEFAPMGARIVRLALSDGGSWQARLDKADAVIEIGRGDVDEVVQRARRFALSVRQVSAQFEQRPVVHADLRHRDGYALQLLGLGTKEPATAGTLRRR
ncbi:cell division protein FtsQ/DivIB [Leptothrix discophora]|uniref:Cell division protein FtsQ n=1 Tax=Leptothrix discophora TaxID=89 RepID=A0ABT9FZU9_LEPDI|nr:cell division protein FtsQ/DivIB [Leptothrix discophora]MDP4299738.1 cell division protein FtsQ/DivIB [Leptothrix discophora]